MRMKNQNEAEIASELELMNALNDGHGADVLLETWSCRIIETKQLNKHMREAMFDSSAPRNQILT
jgi:hypothetical protein